jgi:hypothetical protein
LGEVVVLVQELAEEYFLLAAAVLAMVLVEVVLI